MPNLTLPIVRTVKASRASEEEIIAAIEALSKPKPKAKPNSTRRRYTRRDMRAEA